MSFMLSGTAYSNLIFFGSSMGLNYASARYEFDLTQYIWESSYRSDQLESLLPILKEDMERRLSDLLKARAALAERIQFMKWQLTESEKGDHS